MVQKKNYRLAEAVRDALNELNMFTLEVLRVNNPPEEVELEEVTIIPLLWSSPSRPKTHKVMYVYYDNESKNVYSFLLLRQKGTALPWWDIGRSGEKKLDAHPAHPEKETLKMLKKMTSLIKQSRKVAEEASS